jgi:hypothetical protein
MCSTVMLFSTSRRRVSPAKSAIATQLSKTSLNPAKPVRPRLDLEARLQKPLVVAVARAQHHSMLAKPHRGFVRIGGHMFDGENRHERSIEWQS